MLDLLASDPTSIDTPTPDKGATALHHACYHGNYLAAELLLERVRRDRRRSAFGVDVRCCSAVLIFLGDIIASDSATPPNNLITTTASATQGADANARDKKRRNALHHACFSADRHVIALCLRYGANPKSKESESRMPHQIIPPRGNKSLIDWSVGRACARVLVFEPMRPRGQREALWVCETRKCRLDLVVGVRTIDGVRAPPPLCCLTFGRYKRQVSSDKPMSKNDAKLLTAINDGNELGKFFFFFRCV